MPVFLVNTLTNDPKPLDAAVEARISTDDRYKLTSNRGWLIKFDGTSVQLSNFLEITGQEEGEKSVIGPAIVTLIGSYYGRGPTDMWEWLSLKFS